MERIRLEVKGEKAEIVEVFSVSEVQNRVSQLAAEIASRYLQDKIWQDGETIVIMPILEGAIFLGKDLMEKLSLFFPPSTLELETYGISSYGDKLTPDQIRIVKDTKRPLTGKHLLIVEDIVDTGKTLETLTRILKAHHRPLSLKVCVLIDKKGRREKDIQLDFVGFLLDQPWWLVGYGLDWKGKGRSLPWIGRLVEPKK